VLWFLPGGSLITTADAAPGAAITCSSRCECEDNRARPAPLRDPKTSPVQHPSCLPDTDGYVDVPEKKQAALSPLRAQMVASRLVKTL